MINHNILGINAPGDIEISVVDVIKPKVGA
jgi:hypothetical protein